MKGFLYDPHTHTAQTSRCGRLPAAEVVDRYVRRGFTGLIVTDHLHPEYLSRVDTEHSWDKVMDHYLSGYHASKKRGDEVGFDVLLGAEFRFPENDNDYLVYGIDEQWLRSHPYACCTSAQEFFDRYHEEVLIIHAHPFRKGSAPVQESAVHGVELINGNPRHENHHDLALALCRRHPEYFRTAGSDTHQAGDEARAGVIVPRRLRDSCDYKAIVKSGDFRLWGPEFQAYVDADEALRGEAAR